MTLARIRKVIPGPLVRTARLLLHPEIRRQEQQAQAAFAEFKRRSKVMWRDAPVFPPPERRVLLVASNFLGTTKIEVGFLSALRMAGFLPSVLLWRYNTWIERHFRLWGVDRFLYWDDYLPSETAMTDIEGLKTFGDVLAYQVNGARVGKYAASWVMRTRRVGTFDPGDAESWRRLLEGLEEGARCALAAAKVLQAAAPDTVILLERGYSPWGQLFDLCLHQGVDVIQWVSSHKDNALVLKRYNRQNADVHPSSLSQASWEAVKEMRWDQGKAQAVYDELYRNYESGQWFGEVGTQFHKKMLPAAELDTKLDLDPRKKTAVIFPHLFWDATFFYGRDLFADYEDWFVQTVRAAVENPGLNWVIKIHPANIVKRQRDGYQGEYSEIVAIQQRVGELPPHVKVIGAESDISTFSLFSVMDYCITVRGTIGIEAASFGIPVLTAGTGRYDHLGFTIDSESVDEYLGRLARLHELGPLAPHQHELAQRFAYGIFLMRPFNLQSFTFKFHQDARASLAVDFCAPTVRELVEAPDMRSFREWVCSPAVEDWLAVPAGSLWETLVT